MKQVQYMVGFNHPKGTFTPDCSVIKKEKVNVIRIGYKNIDTRKTDQ